MVDARVVGWHVHLVAPQERDSQQHELGELRAQSLRSQQQIEELKAEQDATDDWRARRAHV